MTAMFNLTFRKNTSWTNQHLEFICNLYYQKHTTSQQVNDISTIFLHNQLWPFDSHFSCVHEYKTSAEQQNSSIVNIYNKKSAHLTKDQIDQIRDISPCWVDKSTIKQT